MPDAAQRLPETRFRKQAKQRRRVIEYVKELTGEVDPIDGKPVQPR
jgi:hypothetical protein